MRLADKRAAGIERAEGVNGWADVIATTNKAKGLFDNDEDGRFGYKADLWGVAVGADWQAPCGAVVGAALVAGQADAKSTGFTQGIDTDIDFYGVRVYAAHQMGNIIRWAT